MEDTKTIFEKVAEIQDEVGNISKDGENPHFKNKYATYEKVLEVLNPILRKHKLVVVHSFEESKFENQIGVVTAITSLDGHTAKSLQTTLFIPITKADPQMAGSAITYAKRYSILAMLGLGTEDDDGEGAVRPQETKPTGTITREPAENAVDTGLISKCMLHNAEMIQKVSAKTGNPYWSHRMGTELCFGKEQR